MKARAEAEQAVQEKLEKKTPSESSEPKPSPQKDAP